MHRDRLLDAVGLRHCGDADIGTPVISHRAGFTTANTAALSVILTFTSLPSRVLMLSVGPSTASMVPRMRTVGGCWAHAVDASTAMSASDASARGSNEDSFGMVLSSLGFFDQRQNTATAGLFRQVHLYIGGVSPLRPTLIRSASNEPSDCFLKKAMILAPGFSSDFSAGT